MEKFYFVTTKEARKGNITVVKSPYRTYGYSLKHIPSGQTGAWYRYKRDAQKRISDLVDCPNTPW